MPCKSGWIIADELARPHQQLGPLRPWAKEPRAKKAAEDSRTPRRSRGVTCAHSFRGICARRRVSRVSVLECGCPLPLFQKSLLYESVHGKTLASKCRVSAGA